MSSEIVKLIGEDGFTKEIAVPNNQYYISLPVLNQTTAYWKTDTMFVNDRLDIRSREFKRSHRDERGQWVFKEVPPYQSKKKEHDHNWQFAGWEKWDEPGNNFVCECGATKRVRPTHWLYE